MPAEDAAVHQVVHGPAGDAEVARGFLQAEPFVHRRARAYRPTGPLRLVLADWCVPVHTSARRYEMAKRSRRPSEVTVWYRGVPFKLDLVRCRRALVGCQIEGKFERMEELADSIGISRSTCSRFFSGRTTSLTVT